jgi:peptidoglycan/LPS O-acetylase OafA/YrhL
MLVLINNPISATGIFFIILFLALCLSVRPREIKEWLPISLTTELKGLAILMIIFSHIGYFLVSDTRFLWPLSIMAGIGVNLFLFLSGYGLAVSQIKKSLSIGQFYARRLLKLFIPFWLLLAIILPLDVLVLKINYSWSVIGKAVFGIFAHANLYQDFNSPLWYLTFIIGYYLLFPLVFSQRRPWLSALVLAVAGYLLIQINPQFFENVIYLYRVHILAFPLGVFMAWLVPKLPNPSVFFDWLRDRRMIFYYCLIAAAIALFIWANVNSGVGGNYHWEELMSLIAIFALLVIFVLKKIEFKLFYLLGAYSYEIYLWHWPILYRYDIFYKWLPVWLATILYLVFFIAFGWLLAKIAGLITKKLA